MVSRLSNCFLWYPNLSKGIPWSNSIWASSIEAHHSCVLVISFISLEIMKSEPRYAPVNRAIFSKAELIALSILLVGKFARLLDISAKILSILKLRSKAFSAWTSSVMSWFIAREAGLPWKVILETCVSMYIVFPFLSISCIVYFTGTGSPFSLALAKFWEYSLNAGATWRNAGVPISSSEVSYPKSSTAALFTWRYVVPSRIKTGSFRRSSNSMNGFAGSTSIYLTITESRVL